MFFTQTDIQLLDAVLRVIALLCQLYINMGILVQDVKNHYSDAYQYKCTRRLGVSNLVSQHINNKTLLY